MVSDILHRAKSMVNSKTAYIKGCDGVLMTDKAKVRYANSDPFNAKRMKMIFSLPEETIGFDEFGFFTYITGIECKNFGDILSNCHDISKNFRNIVPGEIVFNENQFGIFVSRGKVITISTNGVVYVPLKDWVSHAKLNCVSYEEETHDNERKVERNIDRKTENSEGSSYDKTDVEVCDDGIGIGNRMQQMPSQDKSDDSSNG